MVRPNIPLGAYGQRTLQTLERDLVLKSERREWPGTRLPGGSATVYLVRLTKRSLETLCSRASRLYEWVQPRLPEDLCLMRNRSRSMLVSISHERDAYLLLSKDEQQELLSAVPNLRIRRE